MAVQIGDSAVYAPTTAATQSCQRVHALLSEAITSLLLPVREPDLTQITLGLTDRPVNAVRDAGLGNNAVAQRVCATAKMRRNGNQVLPSGRGG